MFTKNEVIIMSLLSGAIAYGLDGIVEVNKINKQTEERKEIFTGLENILGVLKLKMIKEESAAKKLENIKSHIKEKA